MAKVETRKEGKTWSVFVDNEKVEGGFFKKEAAEEAAEGYKTEKKKAAIKPKEEPKKDTKKAEAKKEEVKKDMKKEEVKKDMKKEEAKKEEAKKEDVSKLSDEEIAKEIERRKEEEARQQEQEEAKKKEEEEKEWKARHGAEPPHGACQELQDGWLKGVFGMYDPDSEWCEGDSKGKGGCKQDFPECYVICKKNTQEMQQKRAEKGSKAGTKTGTKTRTRSGERDIFGQTVGSGANKINMLLMRPEGATMEELVACRGGVGEHLNTLKKKRGATGFDPIKIEGRWYLKPFKKPGSATTDAKEAVTTA